MLCWEPTCFQQLFTCCHPLVILRFVCCLQGFVPAYIGRLKMIGKTSWDDTKIGVCRHSSWCYPYVAFVRIPTSRHLPKLRQPHTHFTQSFVSSSFIHPFWLSVTTRAMTPDMGHGQRELKPTLQSELLNLHVAYHCCLLGHHPVKEKRLSTQHSVSYMTGLFLVWMCAGPWPFTAVSP